MDSFTLKLRFTRSELLCRTQAVLTVFSGESKFQIFETNDFTKLALISLSFQPSSDEEAKQVNGISESEPDTHRNLEVACCCLYFFY